MIRWLDEDTARLAGGAKWAGVDDDTIAAWVAEMDLAPPPAVTDALHAAIDRHATLYPPRFVPAVATTIADWHGRRLSQPVEPDRVRFAGDVLAAIRHVFAVALAPGDAVVVPSPAYPPFFEALEAAGVVARRVPLHPDGRRFALDLAAIDAALDGGGRAVLVCNPHNPTGSAPTPAELVALAGIAQRHDALLVSDEVHAPLALPGAVVTPLSVAAPEAADRLVTVTSGSKAYNLPGLRLAWLVTHADAMTDRIGNPGYDWSGPGMVAAAAALEHGDEWLDRLVVDLGRRHATVRRRLEPAGAVVSDPAASFLSWIDLTGTPVGDDPATAIEAAGVRVEPGPRFGDEGRGWIRLNVGASEETLARALDRIEGVL